MPIFLVDTGNFWNYADPYTRLTKAKINAKLARKLHYNLLTPTLKQIALQKFYSPRSSLKLPLLTTNLLHQSTYLFPPYHILHVGKKKIAVLATTLPSPPKPPMAKLLQNIQILPASSSLHQFLPALLPQTDTTLLILTEKKLPNLLQEAALASRYNQLDIILSSYPSNTQLQHYRIANTNVFQQPHSNHQISQFHLRWKHRTLQIQGKQISLNPYPPDQEILQFLAKQFQNLEKKYISSTLTLPPICSRNTPLSQAYLTQTFYLLLQRETQAQLILHTSHYHLNLQNHFPLSFLLLPTLKSHLPPHEIALKLQLTGQQILAFYKHPLRSSNILFAGLNEKQQEKQIVYSIANQPVLPNKKYTILCLGLPLAKEILEFAGTNEFQILRKNFFTTFLDALDIYSFPK